MLDNITQIAIIIIKGKIFNKDKNVIIPTPYHEVNNFERFVIK